MRSVAVFLFLIVFTVRVSGQEEKEVYRKVADDF